MEAKKVIRDQMKKILTLLTQKEKDEQSKLIINKVINDPHFELAKRISVFIGLENEINTDVIFQKIFKSGKKCYVPKIKIKSREMNMVEVKSFKEYQQLPKTIWGIKQPLNFDFKDEAIYSGGLDLMIVPGCAFTKSGHRLGYGKGYYDCYLNRYKKTLNSLPVTIGICFNQQILDQIPMESHDVVINKVITSL